MPFFNIIDLNKLDLSIKSSKQELMMGEASSQQLCSNIPFLQQLILKYFDYHYQFLLRKQLNFQSSTSNF